MEKMTFCIFHLRTRAPPGKGSLRHCRATRGNIAVPHFFAPSSRGAAPLPD
jgi:hypothetical protein